MVLWQGGPAVAVRWFRAPEGAVVAPQPSSFTSSTWDTTDEGFYPPVGEAWPSKRSYDKGANPVGYLGQGYCGSASAWFNGGVYGVDKAILTNPDGSSSCCGVAVQNAQGGVGLGGSSIFPVGFVGGVVWGGYLSNYDTFAGGVKWGGYLSNYDTFVGGVQWGGTLAPVGNFAGGVLWAGGIAHHDLFAGGVLWAGGVGALEVFAGGVQWGGSGGVLAIVEGGVQWGGTLTSSSTYAQVFSGGVQWGGSFSTVTPGLDNYAGGVQWGGEAYSLAVPPQVFSGGLQWAGEVFLPLRPYQTFTGGVQWDGPINLSSSYLATLTGGVLWAGDLYEGMVSYPTFCSLFADEALPSGSGYITYQVDPNQPYAFYSWYTAPALGDSFTWPFFLAGGNYNMYLLNVSGNNRGQVEVYIDGVLQGGFIDMYTGGIGYGSYLALNVNVAGDGQHTLEIKVSGKNAASSDYFFLCTKVTFG